MNDLATRTNLRALILISNIVWGLLLYPAFVFAWLSLMALAKANILTWLAVSTLFFLPGILLLSIIGSWVAFARQKYKAVIILVLLPLFHILVLCFFFYLAQTFG